MDSNKIKLQEAKRLIKKHSIKTSGELRSVNRKLYDSLSYFNLLSGLNLKKRTSPTEWTRDRVQKLIKTEKIKTRNELREKHGGAYNYCLKNGLVDKIFSNVRNKGFSEKQERHEENVIHPKVVKYLKSIGLDVEQEVIISRRSRVDIIATNKHGRKILVEVKSDKKIHTQNSLSEQVTRYQTDGKKKYGNAYAKTFLVSLNGRYGLTLEEMKLQMKQMRLI